MNLNSLFMSEGNQAPLITCIIPSQRWSMVAAASCSGSVFHRQGLGKWSEKTESWMQLNTDILNENLVQCAQTLGWKFTLQHDNHPTHTAKTMQAYGRLYECPRVAQPELRLGTNQTSLEKPINGCPPMIPSQPDRSWDDLKRRMANADVQSLLHHTQKDLRL